MNSRQLVSKVINGEKVSKTPIYGWVKANLEKELISEFGSVEKFEDKYEFDLAHIFGAPYVYGTDEIKKLKDSNVTITPEMALELPFKKVDASTDYKRVIKSLKFYQEDRQRFCYIQTPGIFESLNSLFGIENHLMYMALYPEQMKEIYKKQGLWNRENADHLIDLGVDMIHVSDDWGAQDTMMFSYNMFREYIYSNHKLTCDRVKERGVFLSLHSDGNINTALDSVVELGYNVVHPYQETANMSYDIFLDKYKDKFAIMGGLCIQSTLGFGDFPRVKSEIERVFNILKDKRWIFCTTHFVQDHCSIEELKYAYDLALKLAKQPK